jgi:hypothetical protein
MLNEVKHLCAHFANLDICSYSIPRIDIFLGGVFSTPAEAWSPKPEITVDSPPT